MIVLISIELNGIAWYPNQRVIITGQAILHNYSAVLLHTHKDYCVREIWPHYCELRDFNWFQPILIGIVQYNQVLNASY
jgi:hypothetical protein